MSTHQHPTLYSLQIGRAVAALAVVIHHAILTTNTLFTDLPDVWLQSLALGYLGVDYFFVLSGFIIAHATWHTPPNAAGAKHYILSRLTRIYTPYLPITLGMLAILTCIPILSASTSRADYSLFFSFTLLPSNNALLLPVAWSLQHELFFYTLFAVCFFLFRNPRLIFLWAVPIIGILFTDLAGRGWGVVAGFLNLEFLFGVAVYHAYRHQWFLQRPYLLLLAGSALLTVAGAVLFGESFMHYKRVIAGGGFACIVLGLVHLETRIDFSRFRLLIFLGGASYSIYLVHATVLSAMVRLPLHLPNWQIGFAALALCSTLAGVIYFRLVEKPLLALVRKHLA